MIDHRQGIAIAVIAETELPLVVDGHEVVGFDRLAARAERMCRRRAALARLHQVRATENIAGRAGRRPFDVRMQLGEPGDDLARPHVREAAAKLNDLLAHLIARPMRNVQRSAGAVDESSDAVDVMPGKPFVQLLTAHSEALGELGDRVQTAQIRLNESRSFSHRTGDLPWHHTPSLPEDECHPCSRSVLSPMCPVCTQSPAATSPQHGNTDRGTDSFEASCHPRVEANRRTFTSSMKVGSRNSGLILSSCRSQAGSRSMNYVRSSGSSEQIE